MDKASASGAGDSRFESWADQSVCEDWTMGSMQPQQLGQGQEDLAQEKHGLHARSNCPGQGFCR